jgi:CBS domain-containing protein
LAKSEPLIKEVGHHDQYQVVDPDLSLPKVAAKFAERPDDVLLVYDKETDEFLGSLYLYDFHRAYANPPKKWKGNIHNTTIADVMSTNIATIEWSANVSQAWGLVTTKRPSAILLKDDKGRFAGYLSNKDLWTALEQLDENPALIGA